MEESESRLPMIGSGMPRWSSADVAPDQRRNRHAQLQCLRLAGADHKVGARHHASRRTRHQLDGAIQALKDSAWLGLSTRSSRTSAVQKVAR